ncbi:MAG: helix-turn-helix transcriptional regulator [Chloroflexi bacterium]|nr:helix-turn-helix transcriptional regulator [Chloroflexota bacterium]
MTRPKDRDVTATVRNLRSQLGLTQEQFAAKVGVTWSTVNRWENGRGKPSPLARQKIEELVPVARRRGDGEDITPYQPERRSSKG